jgi:hypothetical protein
LAIALPEQLWTLLGISTVSLVGSPLILSTKLPKEPTPQEEEAFIAKKVAKFDKENAEIIAANFMDTKGKEITDIKFAQKIFENSTIEAKLKTLAKGETGKEAKAKMLALKELGLMLKETEHSTSTKILKMPASLTCSREMKKGIAIISIWPKCKCFSSR